ncbi:MAG: hypothetical protein IT372_13890 [Polyangiaceae bacterium]|nr:hypothetical protein [Polyangiaceae bacterium]
MNRTIGLPWLAAAAALALSLAAGDARACGGCFHPDEQTPEQASPRAARIPVSSSL